VPDDDTSANEDQLEPDADAHLASAFRIAVMRLSRRLRSERSDETLGLSQLSALATLIRNGPLSPTALAELERIQPPSMTRVITALEERGLLERAPHPTDGRQSVIVLEDRRRRAAWLAQRFATLSPEEQQQIADALPLIERIGESD
jgi:DNA-binding MarR family transcriptional regulator